ncbi:ATPase involved in chromosome partitioning [Mycobacteroides abscessus subsp. abscessus]|nr:ATPase involved in chromosome partitioning [Mycobacteroides abscessus subsp. abscessus]
MGSTPTPSSWPRIEASINTDGTAVVSLNGTQETVNAESVGHAREQITARITRVAQQLSRPVRATTTDPDGIWEIVISPDGTVENYSNAPARGRRTQTPSSAPTPPPAPTTNGPAQQQWTPQPAVTQHEPPLSTTGDTPLPDPVDDEWETIAARPAEDGARGFMNKTFAAKLAPGEAELAARKKALDDDRRQREAEQLEAQRQSEQESRRAARERAQAARLREQRATIQTNFQATKTVLIANPKGGARKTTTTYLLAATMGIIRGGSCIAWDANETMGTLGERSHTDTHTRTVVDLLEDAAADFASLESSRVGRLDAFVRPQGDAHFDVLASDEDPTRQDIVDAHGFDTVHEILSRFYRMIFVDTGNNIRASHFQAALSEADQLVIPVAASFDSADVAEQMMRAFEASGHGELVKRAVVLIHDLEPANSDPTYFDTARQIAERFSDRAAAVLPIPFDSALKAGGRIDYAELAPATQQAYQDAAAAVATSLRTTMQEH